MAKGAATPVTSLDHNNTKMMYGRTATVQQQLYYISNLTLDLSDSNASTTAGSIGMAFSPVFITAPHGLTPHVKSCLGV